MAHLFSPDLQWLWTVALGGALFVPVRHLIWVMAVRRAEARDGSADAARRASLKRRAAVTAGLLCFVFAVAYVHYLFHGPK